MPETHTPYLEESCYQYFEPLKLTRSHSSGHCRSQIFSLFRALLKILTILKTYFAQLNNAKHSCFKIPPVILIFVND